MNNGIDIETLKMAVRHLPPNARRHAERELGLPSTVEEQHKVFVCGTLLAGERNAGVAMNSRRQKAWTLGTVYDIGRDDPALVKRGNTRIDGELLTVNERILRSMDRIMGYPDLHRRQQYQVNLVGGGRVLAWMYLIGRLPEKATVIEDGDWRKHRRA